MASHIMNLLLQSQPTNAPNPTCSNGETLLELKLTTDNYPAETSWSIVNACTSSTVSSSTGYSLTGTNYDDNLCLDDGAQYTFTINDTYGDGTFFLA